jgi:hypothetical protein
MPVFLFGVVCSGRRRNARQPLPWIACIHGSSATAAGVRDEQIDLPHSRTDPAIVA